jgi:HSP20 family protein
VACSLLEGEHPFLLKSQKAETMGTIQQRFEVEQPAQAVYEALAEPGDVLRTLPGVALVTRDSDDHYRVTVTTAEGTRETSVQLVRHAELRRVEWRTVDGAWTGAFTVEPIGPARSAVGVHAESTGGPEHSPPASAVHDALQALKRTLQSREIRVSHAQNSAYAGAYSGSASARPYASDWREATRSAFARADNPFALMRTFTRQVDRVWEQVWRGTPMARLPHVVPSLLPHRLPSLLPWNPSVEVCEQDDQVRVCIDVPGIDESKIAVEIDDGVLVVRGDRQDERASEPGQRRSELHYGAFTRRIPLPEGVDADAARAILRNGVLEVRIPRNRREPRRVPVQHAS